MSVRVLAGRESKRYKVASFTNVSETAMGRRVLERAGETELSSAIGEVAGGYVLKKGSEGF
jgi:hypothetical protein